MDLAQIGEWQRRWLHDGVLLVGPEGAAGERLRIRTHQRPLRPFHQLLGEAAVGTFERFTTLEGEYAGLVDTRQGDETTVSAMIVGDDSHTLIVGTTPRAERAEWIRDLVRTVARFFPLGLGHPRRRRYYYKPPPDWQPVAREGCVVWLNPEFPRVAARLTMFDARPLRWFAPGAVDRFLFIDENPFASKDPPLPPIAVAGAIAGTAQRMTGRAADGTPLAMMKVLAQDANYAYIVQLESRLDEFDSCVATVEDVLGSIEPVPMPELGPSATQFVHWIE